jgi:hypothetical protein
MTKFFPGFEYNNDLTDEAAERMEGGAGLF